MSRFDYEASKRVAASDHPFAVLIVAAMRKADTDKRRGGRCLDTGTAICTLVLWE